MDADNISTMNLGLGIDTGGTYTDAVILTLSLIHI